MNVGHVNENIPFPHRPMAAQNTFERSYAQVNLGMAIIVTFSEESLTAYRAFVRTFWILFRWKYYLIQGAQVYVHSPVGRETIA